MPQKIFQSYLWRDLQLKIDYIQGTIYSKNFCQKTAERKYPKQFFFFNFAFVFEVWAHRLLSSRTKKKNLERRYKGMYWSLEKIILLAKDFVSLNTPKKSERISTNWFFPVGSKETSYDIKRFWDVFSYLNGDAGFKRSRSIEQLHDPILGLRILPYCRPDSLAFFPEFGNRINSSSITFHLLINI